MSVRWLSPGPNVLEVDVNQGVEVAALRLVQGVVTDGVCRKKASKVRRLSRRCRRRRRRCRR